MSDELLCNPFDQGPGDSYPHHGHYDPAVDTQGIIGDPVPDMMAWHQQVHPDTCAIVSQGFVIESLTGGHVSEDNLVREAMDHGCYVPGSGTPMYHVGHLLEDYGISVEQERGATIADIVDKLNNDQKVIVAVNAEDIKNHAIATDSLFGYPGISGQPADHAVEVIGINVADPTHPLVILNDPGASDGRGIEIPVDVFDRAWASSNYFILNTADADTFAQ